MMRVDIIEFIDCVSVKLKEAKERDNKEEMFRLLVVLKGAIEDTLAYSVEWPRYGGVTSGGKPIAR